MIKKLGMAFLLFYSLSASAGQALNVYAWAGEIPQEIIHDFEKETGIPVNFSIFDSNETMFAKLKASSKGIYDVIMPSGYYVERMRKQNMLARINHRQLGNIEHLAPKFKEAEFDPGNHYSVPYIWGSTGFFYNKQWVKHPPKRWQDLWEKRWRKKLLILNDSREVFAMALLSLGYSPNDDDPRHIKQAYEQLLKLKPNIKLFASDNIQSIMIDEDAEAGAVWNADAYKAHQENDNVVFVYPENGFVLWADCFAIPSNAPHPKEAYQFINYMMRPETAKKLAMISQHPITNAAAKSLLPASMTENTTLYPPESTLKHAEFQRDAGEKTLRLYHQYWQLLKMSF